MFDSFYAETLRKYKEWIVSSFKAPAVPDRVRDYLLHMAIESPAGKYQTLWPHQRQAVLRTIFANEILKPRDAGWKDLLLNVVTGGGKTTIIATIMAYLRVCHEVRSFLLLSPNTIVRERLKTDFEKPRSTTKSSISSRSPARRFSAWTRLRRPTGRMARAAKPDDLSLRDQGGCQRRHY